MEAARSMACNTRGLSKLLTFLLLLASEAAPGWKASSVVTIAGGSSASLLDGHGADAQFFEPRGIVFYGNELFVADTGNSVVRKVDSKHHVETFSGNGKVGVFSGDSFESSYEMPTDITYDEVIDKLLVSDGYSLRLVDVHDGSVQTLPALSPKRGDGAMWGVAAGHHVLAFTVPDTNQVVLILVGCKDYVCQCTAGSFSQVCGISAPTRSGHVDGLLSKAAFNKPHGVVIRGNVAYVADTGNHAIRAITFNPRVFDDPSLLFQAQVRTVAGFSSRGFQDGNLDYAQFNSPYDLCFLSAHVFVLADRDNHRVRLVDLELKQVYTLAGSQSGFDDGAASSSSFLTPEDVACADSSVWVSDTGNHAIRHLTLERANIHPTEPAPNMGLHLDAGQGAGNKAAWSMYWVIVGVVALVSALVGVTYRKMRRARQQYRLVPSFFVNETAF